LADLKSMNSAARPYVLRAPRYTLSVSDRRLLRFKGENLADGTIEAEVFNLSMTGLAFAVHRFDAPNLGEELKIEFAVPGGQTIAWYAQVVRIESQPEWQAEIGGPVLKPEDVKVAVRFAALPAPFRRELQDSLRKRVTPEETDVIDLSKPVSDGSKTQSTALLPSETNLSTGELLKLILAGLALTATFAANFFTL